MQKAREKGPTRGAFSLIEVTLALLVFGLGIMGILSLFPGGVKLSNDSYMETRVVAFAEHILNAVAAELDMNPAMWNQSPWEEYEIPYSSPAFGIWDNEDDLAIYAGVTNGNGIMTNVYRLASDPDDIDYAFRYKLTVERANMNVVVLWDESNSVYCSPQTFEFDPTHPDVPWGHRTNELFSVMTSPVKEWVTAGDYIMKATLAIWPGEYGGDARYFYRYYYKF